MLTISKDLPKNKEYSFQTTGSGRTLPMTVEQFLNSSHAKEKLVTVNECSGPESKCIWSTHNGWDEQAYSDLVCEFVSLIDKTQDVNPEFIDSAIQDGLSVSEAVDSWFSGY